MAGVMPYTTKDVPQFTKKARSAKRKRQWTHVYKSARARGWSEGRAIQQASGVVKKSVSKKRRKRRSSKQRK